MNRYKLFNLILLYENNSTLRTLVNSNFRYEIFSKRYYLHFRFLEDN